MGLRDEIFEQPDVLQRWLDTQLPHAQRVAEIIRARDVEYVFLAARGTSDHAGIYAQYLWGSLNRLPVALAAPSLFTLYSGSPRLQKALVVGISQSGESPDVVSVLAEGRRQGALTLAITNAPASPLAQTAELTVDIRAGAETAVAATKTYTAELMAVAALSAALSDASEYLGALARVPGAVRQALTLEERAQQIAAQHRALTRCVVLGRGYDYASAQEWALKLKELAYVFADPYSAADFLHGPIAIVERGFPVFVIAPRGAALNDLLTLLHRFRDEYQADLLVISDDDGALALAPSALKLPGDVPEWLTPLVTIIPAQLYAYHLTRAKGYDTQAPRGLHKVTLTR
ncbi:MAG: SIS domain-containing protein [Chloroflexi bacterium]|nr:SIS domain-containing protein [Chloroflexota bacterium]